MAWDEEEDTTPLAGVGDAMPVARRANHLSIEKPDI